MRTGNGAGEDYQQGANAIGKSCKPRACLPTRQCLASINYSNTRACMCSSLEFHNLLFFFSAVDVPFVRTILPITSVVERCRGACRVIPARVAHRPPLAVSHSVVRRLRPTASRLRCVSVCRVVAEFILFHNHHWICHCRHF